MILKVRFLGHPEDGEEKSCLCLFHLKRAITKDLGEDWGGEVGPPPRLW